MCQLIPCPNQVMHCDTAILILWNQKVIREIGNTFECKNPKHLIEKIYVNLTIHLKEQELNYGKLGRERELYVIPTISMRKVKVKIREITDIYTSHAAWFQYKAFNWYFIGF